MGSLHGGGLMARGGGQIPHPAAQALGLYAHVFVNGGSIVGLTGQGRSVRSCLNDFSSSWRWSTVRCLPFLPT